ncbi:MAG: proteasome subunit alpha [Candidatus Schekmanbacteria bacterium RBG_13_48_7]|uniref:Proteasome subunit alpha n=1 Tax=Candidatus Schekmanbacteria bacterium RBG_13_48_7 TaxID=1817878 RepID=A0A1F7RUH0_9BACT|nr:MAG: proteasome subunit alpha [Candidatus Schekmanbacteria bacterium RBG_13_48_7]
MEIGNFISPKKLIEIKRDIVEDALSRSNPILAMEYQNGILLIAENPSYSLHKVSEIFDNIAFAGTGVYNDYERLRKAGVQYADVKGFSYSREDVKAKSIASSYSDTLGEIFSRSNMPMEVEIMLAEVGETQEENRFYYITYSGGLIEEKYFSIIGDIYLDISTKKIEKNLLRNFLKNKNLTGSLNLKETFRLGIDALNSVRTGSKINAEILEAAVLDRKIPKNRKFNRFEKKEIIELIGDGK